jgi:ABC-type multidrug transport system fused ATPase/permease subunit
MNQHSQTTPTTLGIIFRFLLGFAGVAAAVTALLSAFGFLILRANATLLGISFSLFHYSVHDYLYQGILFVFWAVVRFGGKVLGTVIGVLFLCLLLSVLNQRVRGFIRRFQKSKGVKAFQRHGWFWAGYIVAILLLSVSVLKMQLGPEATNLLFTDASRIEIDKRTTDAGRERLANQYGNLILLVIVSAAILFGIHRKGTQVVEPQSPPRRGYDGPPARYRSRKRQPRAGTPRQFRLRRFFLWLLDLIFAAVLIMLPMTYGKTVYSNEFHPVQLILDKALQKDTILEKDLKNAQNIWLLRETPNTLILYFDGKAKSVHAIQKAKVLNFILSKRRNIFAGISDTPP